MSASAEAIASLVPIDRSLERETTSFFDRNTGQRTEIVEGLIREQQLIAFAGPYGVGKSPALADIGFHVLHGLPWCGRKAERRPVVHFDFETPGPIYKANLRNLSARLGLALPKVPEQIDVYLEHDDSTEPATKKLLDALSVTGLKSGLELVRGALSTNPNALVIIDPLELLFRVDTGKKQPVLELYSALRRLMSTFPAAAILTTFNLRKLDGKRMGGRVPLLLDPRAWLEEVCGTLDILNRSDVRLGMDLYEMRVINGIRRGESMDPA
jgi:RecA-family ATPase